MIKRKDVAEKLIDYLCHKITLAKLVDWAENAMMDVEMDSGDIITLREIVSRIGLADVKAFELTWEDCEEFLSRLGYHARLIVREVSMKATAES